MEYKIDLNKEYGIVLEGGGAKGAYQIGVWKAFLEYGVKIKGVSGVSVGALNGALITMGEFDEAERLWSHLTYSSIMDVNDEIMDKLFRGKLKQIKIKDLAKDVIKFITERGIDITPLRRLIDAWVDEDKISNSDIEFIIGTFLLNKLKEVEISAKEADKNYLKDYLLASAYLPAFRNEKIHGMKYLDGGIMNSVPVDMLINRGYQDIIVIRIYGIGIVKPINIPKGVRIIEIAPRKNLGGLLEFNPLRIRKNIKLGYLDGVRGIKGLKGKLYYIDWTMEEVDSLLYFYHVHESVKMALLEYYKYEFNDKTYNRIFIENICPLLANTLKLDKEWTYTDLLVTCIELSAKTVKVPKYSIYTKESIIYLINKNYSKVDDSNLPIFPRLILKLVTIHS